MSAAPVIESADHGDEVLRRLFGTSAWLATLVGQRETAEPVSQAARIDRIASIERLQASLEAAKCAEIVADTMSLLTGLLPVEQGLPAWSPASPDKSTPQTPASRWASSCPSAR